MGKYITDAYARIQCTVCGNKLVDVLKPGTSFDDIKECQECAEKTPDYDAMELEELQKACKDKGIMFASNAKEETLRKKLKG